MGGPSKLTHPSMRPGLHKWLTKRNPSRQDSSTSDVPLMFNLSSKQISMVLTKRGPQALRSQDLLGGVLCRHASPLCFLRLGIHRQKARLGLPLDGYWVGSLDFDFLANEGVFY